MAISLLERVAAALFGGGSSLRTTQRSAQLVADVTELVVEAVEPRVRFRPRYQDKLEGCVCKEHCPPALHRARAAGAHPPRASGMDTTIRA